MDLSQYWRSGDQQEQILPALAELNQEGIVDRAGDWAGLKSEVLAKLERNGVSGSSRDELMKPLDEAVGGGSEFKSLVVEMVKDYQAARQRPTATPQQTASPGKQQDAPLKDQGDPEFTASLPDLNELANQIVMDLGEGIADLIASSSELAEVSDQELMQWITEDVSATLDEIGEYGWEQLG